ncbi:MAG: LysM peptidoglycan-binding domain-containing protein [Muribaculaceae bacterium]|nr:LysM peptidoglycan-binding domain-containing protein [Muribaculaceae bacterium]
MKLRILLAALLLSTVGTSVMARTELPVTQVNGKACYCYTVSKKQTLYSVADELGLTRDEIVKYNPSANDGVKSGQTLYFPVDKFPGLGDSDKTVAISKGTYTVKKGDSFYGICYKLGVSSDALLAANPSVASGVKVGQVLQIPSEALSRQTEEESMAREEANDGDRILSTMPVRPTIVPISQGDSIDEAAIEKTANIVVMLPFMLNQQEPDKHALNATDFYKGMLLAADSLSHKRGQVNIYTFDTEGSTDRVRAFCQTDTFRNAAVVIAPDDLAQLNIIGSHAPTDDMYVFNAFVVRDSSYLYNPRMLQSYIPSNEMLDKAANAVKTNFPGATPVILHRAGARDDKAEFIDKLREVFAATDTPALTVEFNEVLTASDLARLPNGGDYVLIPSSGSLTEFNKICGAVLEAREDAIGGSTYNIFGYPDWTSFRGANREMLHRLGATIYTRFYYDPFSEQIKNLEARYNAEYGGNMVDAVPSPAVLGFDTAWFLIQNLRRGGSEYVPESDAYYGAQSSFHFVKADPDDSGSGYYNDELYIIRFSIDGIHTDRLQ